MRYYHHCFRCKALRPFLLEEKHESSTHFIAIFTCCICGVKKQLEISRERYEETLATYAKKEKK